MRKYIIPFVVMCLLAGVFNLMRVPEVLEAQHGNSGKYSNVFVSAAYEELVGTSTNVEAISPGIITTTGLQKTQRAYITFSGQGARWTADGTTPSTTLGIPVAAGSSIELIGLLDIQNFQYANDDDTGTSTAHVTTQYEKEMN